MRVGGQHHGPAALPPGETRYPLYRRLNGPQGNLIQGNYTNCQCKRKGNGKFFISKP